MATPAKRKRNVLTLKEKVELLEKLENGVSRAQLGKEYNVGSSTIYDIKRQSHQLKDFFSKKKSIAENRHTLHRPRCEDLDRVLYDWYSSKTSDGVCISNRMLREKAKELQVEMKIPVECSFSRGWLARFKQRHGIGKLEAPDERESADEMSDTDLIEKFNNLITEHNVGADQIYSAIETMLLWKYLPIASLNRTTADFPKENTDRVAVLLCANATGNHKVKLTVVGKHQNPRCFKNLTDLPVDYQSQRNAMMDADIVMAWFRDVFVSSVKLYLREKGLPQDSKVFLLFDDSSIHLPVEDLVYGNVFVMYLPSSVISLTLPMNRSVTQNLKTSYRDLFMRRCVTFEGSLQEFQQDFTLKDAMFMLSIAWKLIQFDTLRHSWRHLCPEVIREGVEVGGRKAERSRMQCSGIKDIFDLVQHSDKVSMTEDEVREWVEVDNAIPVAASLDDDDGQVIEKKEVEQEDRTPKVSWKEADASLQTFIRFAEQCSYMSSDDVMQLHCIHNEFLKRKRHVSKQADIQKLLKLEVPPYSRP